MSNKLNPEIYELTLKIISFHIYFFHVFVIIILGTRSKKKDDMSNKNTKLLSPPSFPFPVYFLLWEEQTTRRPQHTLSSEIQSEKLICAWVSEQGCLPTFCQLMVYYYSETDHCSDIGLISSCEIDDDEKRGIIKKYVFQERRVREKRV